MTYRGDIRLGDTIDIKFATVNTSGVPTQLAGTPSVAAYPGNSTTEITAGITLTVDFDARTGLNNIRVVATSGNGYATATNYDLIITAGTVGGSSVVGYVVGSFSIEARSALMPTTAARTLDVTAANKVNGVVLTDTVTTYTGNTPQTGDSFARLGAPAGASIAADLAAIEAQTDDIGIAGAGLTAITSKTDNLPVDPADQSLIIAATDAIIADTNDIQTRLPAALIGGRIDASVGAMATGVITAAAHAAGVAADNAGITAIKAKTDSLNFTVAGKLDVNLLVINGITVGGNGQPATPWGPV